MKVLTFCLILLYFLEVYIQENGKNNPRSIFKVLQNNLTEVMILNIHMQFILTEFTVY